MYNFDEIVPVSAKKNFNMDELKKVILKLIPEGEFYYNEDILTSQPEKFFASEIIRQQAFKLLHDELPFSLNVIINEFREREKGKNYINASIFVDKESQKGIVIGSNGNMIKTIGEKARKRLEEFTGEQVFLELIVKVKENWKNDEEFIKKSVRHISKPSA
jgi:GTP-binding protein Era